MVKARRSARKGSAAEVVERNMPGWRLAEPEEEVAGPLDEDAENAMKTDEGPSIAKLRRKFGMADNKDEGPAFAPVDDSVETVRVAPKSGGPAKTADIKGGKIKVVQG